MKKLLHERLRDFGKHVEQTKCATFSMGNVVMPLYGVEATVLADEIEKYYYPLQVDKYGNPWKYGDDCITPEGEEGTIVGYRPGGRVFIDLHDERCFACCYASDLKRPAPKVLDADGIEIKVGDTVWKTYPSVLKSKTVSKVGCSARREGHAGHEDAPFVDFVEGGWDYARSVTKRESDSLKKLRNDIRANGGAVATEWARRLTLIMERDM